MEFPNWDWHLRLVGIFTQLSEKTERGPVTINNVIIFFLMKLLRMIAIRISLHCMQIGSTHSLHIVHESKIFDGTHSSQSEPQFLHFLPRWASEWNHFLPFQWLIFNYDQMSLAGTFPPTVIAGNSLSEHFLWSAWCKRVVFKKRQQI